MDRRNGFTLVELLVVISIIALLMAILMPALAKVREQANSVVCKANLSQIVLSSDLWSSDNDDWCVAAFCLQPDPLWGQDKTSTSSTRNPGTLQPYLSEDMYGQKTRKVMVCPTAKHVQPYVHGGYGGDVATLHKRFTYATNGYMTTNSITMEGRPKSPGTPPRRGSRRWDYDGTEVGNLPAGNYAVLHGVTKINAVRKPGETLYFTDCDAPVVSRASLNPFLPRKQLQMAVNNSYNNLGPASRWHDIRSGDDYGYGNIGWVDGHVSKEPKDFAGGTINDQRNWYYLWDH